jgi:hypothetical protein
MNFQAVEGLKIRIVLRSMETLEARSSSNMSQAEQEEVRGKIQYDMVMEQQKAWGALNKGHERKPRSDGRKHKQKSKAIVTRKTDE